MDPQISGFYETLERQLGSEFIDFQGLSHCAKSHLHNEYDRITKFNLAEAKSSKKRIS